MIDVHCLFSDVGILLECLFLDSDHTVCWYRVGCTLVFVVVSCCLCSFSFTKPFMFLLFMLCYSCFCSFVSVTSILLVLLIKATPSHPATTHLQRHQLPPPTPATADPPRPCGRGAPHPNPPQACAEGRRARPSKGSIFQKISFVFRARARLGGV